MNGDSFLINNLHLLNIFTQFFPLYHFLLKWQITSFIVTAQHHKNQQMLVQLICENKLQDKLFNLIKKHSTIFMLNNLEFSQITNLTNISHFKYLIMDK